jgi:ribosomal protein S18 acetylase RimI-like enzyme
MLTPLNYPHDRDHIRLLQHAHADHIEAMYQSMMQLPGNPANVLIQKIGQVRTFIAAGDRLENRAIFTGEESVEQIDEVQNHFINHRANCVIEVNPANYYVDPPKNWEQRLLPQLLKRGCRIDGFRCVWHRSTAPTESPQKYRWQRFTTDEIETYEQTIAPFEPAKHWTPEERAAHSNPNLFHYVGFSADRPVATGSLFITGSIAYLQWFWTHPDFRNRGFQQEGIQIRLRDAFAQGCKHVFSVTDFNFASPRNLQRCGFHLAYNYLLIRQDVRP